MAGGLEAKAAAAESEPSGDDEPGDGEESVADYSSVLDKGEPFAGLKSVGGSVDYTVQSQRLPPGPSTAAELAAWPADLVGRIFGAHVPHGGLRRQRWEASHIGSESFCMS